jgi:hypothetical protein
VLIDLTRKPLIVYPEVCESSVVVRSIGNRDVNGIVSFWLDAERKARRRRDINPDAKITRGPSTLYETRLPLPGVNLAYGQNPYLRDDPHWRNARDFGPEKKRADANILPEPFEVASAYQDTLTGIHGTWRAGLRIEFMEKMKKSPWVVSVLDVTSGVTLSTIAVSGLDPNPLISDPLPLTKAVQRTVAPGNAWTRIMDDDT